jgi:hypothetical protein
MPRKRQTPEQVIKKLREAEIAISRDGTDLPPKNWSR